MLFISQEKTGFKTASGVWGKIAELNDLSLEEVQELADKQTVSNKIFPELCVKA